MEWSVFGKNSVIETTENNKIGCKNITKGKYASN